MRIPEHTRDPTEHGPGMAATPDAFRGGLPGTLRPEHPPANPEDGLAQSARVRPTSMQSDSTCTRTRDACTVQPRTNRTAMRLLLDHTRTRGRSCALPLSSLLLFSSRTLLPCSLFFVLAIGSSPLHALCGCASPGPPPGPPATRPRPVPTREAHGAARRSPPTPCMAAPQSPTRLATLCAQNLPRSQTGTHHLSNPLFTNVHPLRRKN